MYKCYIQYVGKTTENIRERWTRVTLESVKEEKSVCISIYMNEHFQSPDRWALLRMSL